MKSPLQLHQEIESLIDTLNDDDKLKDMKPAAVTKLRNRLLFLRKCKQYMESGATEGFLKKEAERLRSKITAIKGGFKPWSENNQHAIGINPQWPPAMREKVLKKHYDKEMDIKKHRKHYVVVKFLLS